MTKVKELIHFLENIAPLDLQESYDNAGLLTGSPDMQVQGVLCTLDTTPEVVQEAIDNDLNVIVSHHPIIFQGLKSLTGDNYITRSVIKAIKHDIAIYAIHTNLDKVLHNGVNQGMCQQLGLTNIRILQTQNEDPNIGMGAIGELPTELTWSHFLSKVKNDFNLETFKYTSAPGIDKVTRVAVCGGSGSFLLSDAIRAGAQAFISADFKYHQYFDAENKINILDIGHYESEKHTITLLNKLISNKFRNFAAHSTKINTNPVRFYN